MQPSRRASARNIPIYVGLALVASCGCDPPHADLALVGVGAPESTPEERAAITARLRYLSSLRQEYAGYARLSGRAPSGDELSVPLEGGAEQDYESGCGCEIYGAPYYTSYVVDGQWHPEDPWATGTAVITSSTVTLRWTDDSGHPWLATWEVGRSLPWPVDTATGDTGATPVQ